MLVSQITTLGFVLSPDQEKVLMVHRISRKNDDQLGKFNGLGGKVEPGEGIVAGMVRELGEEANIVPTKMRLRGTVSWPGFGPNGENVLGFIFLIEQFLGQIPDSNLEGPLSWHRIADLDKLEMWPGDKYFLPLVFDPSIPSFHGCLPYQKGEPVGWSYTVI